MTPSLEHMRLWRFGTNPHHQHLSATSSSSSRRLLFRGDIMRRWRLEKKLLLAKLTSTLCELSHRHIYILGWFEEFRMRHSWRMSHKTSSVTHHPNTYYRSYSTFYPREIALCPPLPTPITAPETWELRELFVLSTSSTNF